MRESALEDEQCDTGRHQDGCHEAASGVATTSPAGNVSVNPIPVCAGAPGRFATMRVYRSILKNVNPSFLRASRRSA